MVRPTHQALVARLVINRAFALLWCGQVVTDLGNVVFNTAAVLWLAGHISASLAPLAVSGVFLASALPSVLVRPVAGVLVDRRDARRTMLWMDALRALPLLALAGFLTAISRAAAPANTAASLGPLAALYGVLLLAAVCAQFFNPALLALIGDLVPAPDVPRATGLSEATWNLAAVLGPPLAALLLVVASLPWVLALDAVSFAVSFATIAAIRLPAARGRARMAGTAHDFRHELADGLAFIARDRIVRTVAVSLAIAVFGAGALNALNVFFVTANLHAPSAAYGILGGAFGAGSILGSLLAGPLANRVGLARLYSCSLIAVGAVIAAYSRLASIGPAVIMFTMLGIPNAASNAAFAALLLRATPRDLVGRVSSAVVALYSLAALCSYIVAGLLAASMVLRTSVAVGTLSVGPLDTLFAAVGVLIMLGGIFAAVGLGA